MELKAIYSRSELSATSLADSASVDAFWSLPATPSRSLADLLARDDIDAVIIALPIMVQPEVIRQAITAGKHVLSEKPIASNVEDALQLMNWYSAVPRKEIWSIGENFRFMDTMLVAAEKLRSLNGRLLNFSLNFYHMMKEDDKFYNTEWRKNPLHQGGFVLDGGIHFIAALRLLLGASGEELSTVAAFTSLSEPRLAPLDSLSAVCLTKGGTCGTLSMSFGVDSCPKYLEIIMVTDRGTVSVAFDSVKVTTTANGRQANEEIPCKFDMGVKNEVEAFASSLINRTQNEQQCGSQAFEDLKLLEYMLESAKEGVILNTSLS
ncbi:unnamed protein product [Clonostachys chloroleuca]|uniref:Uncharacterized protein n=1 Tax=Clonostachys chloroleuca TaxID=1926264 RepID=A0AA35M323_9HYPO|nr:unnamed protein product [Clonostachys chloroleuca]